MKLYSNINMLCYYDIFLKTFFSFFLSLFPSSLLNKFSLNYQVLYLERSQRVQTRRQTRKEQSWKSQVSVNQSPLPQLKNFL